jgi:plastocyanin
MIDAPPADNFNETRRLVLTVRDVMHFAAKAETSLGIYGYKAQGALHALRLFFLFTTLASSPGLAEDPNNAAAIPAVTVSMDHSTFIPSEITVAPGTTVTWVNVETMPHKDACERRNVLIHLYDLGRLQLSVRDPPEHERQSRRQGGRGLTIALNDPVRVRCPGRLRPNAKCCYL